MHEKRSKVVVLGTGGTIAGWAPDPSKGREYRAAELTASDLIQGLADGQDHILTEEVAQIDSKNMGWPVWLKLVMRLQHWLDQEDVQGVVVTHGTDTMEETAILLHTLFQGTKTVAITGAMRAANVPDPDGPDNLRNALALAGAPGSAGVVCVFAAQVHAAASLSKFDCQALQAFTSTDPVPLAWALDNLDELQKRFSWQETPKVGHIRRSIGNGENLALGGDGLQPCRSRWALGQSDVGQRKTTRCMGGGRHGQWHAECRSGGGLDRSRVSRGLDLAHLTLRQGPSTSLEGRSVSNRAGAQSIPSACGADIGPGGPTAQLVSAWKARDLISSTEPTPLMAL
jgi:hypothetical protein